MMDGPQAHQWANGSGYSIISTVRKARSQTLAIKLVILVLLSRFQISYQLKDFIKIYILSYLWDFVYVLNSSLL